MIARHKGLNEIVKVLQHHQAMIELGLDGYLEECIEPSSNVSLTIGNVLLLIPTEVCQ